MDYSLSNADASFIGEAAGDVAGYFVSHAGDVNGDGYDDILIGADFNDEGGTDAGQTYLILGRSAADWGMDYSLSNADASFIGEAENDRAGYRASGTRDVNGDGYDDFLIGAHGNDEGGEGAGQVYLILGSAAVDWGMDYSLSNVDASFIGEESGDYTGTSVSGAGDVDGDGYDDFLIGAYGDVGHAYLILGSAAADWGMDHSLSNADASFVGEAMSDRVGWSVSDVGDMNQDGWDDFLIGAHRNDGGGTDAGKSYLILGRSATDWGMNYSLSNADTSFLGEAADDHAGWSVSGVADVNRDGYPDFLIGAYRNDESGADAGQAYLVFGGCGLSSFEVGELHISQPPAKALTPLTYKLSQNCPNPFNPETTISYDIAKTGTVRLSIYALTGQRVRTLVDADRPAGAHSVAWDGTDANGRPVASGVYLCCMEAGDFRAVRKMLLIR